MKVPVVGGKKQWALATIPPIKWLIDCEPEVKEAIEAFAADQRDSPILVAGPPSKEDLEKRQQRDDYTGPLALPCVTLHMSKVQHHLTGRWGIQVTASERDVAEIIEWARRKMETKRASVVEAARLQ